MFGAKKNLFTSNYRCIRELLRWLFYLLSQNTKWRSKLNMELWLNDFWVLTSLLREQKTFFFVGNTTWWYGELEKLKYKTNTGLCSTQTQLRHFIISCGSCFQVFRVLFQLHSISFFECISKNTIFVWTRIWWNCYLCSNVFAFFARLSKNSTTNKKNRRRRSQENCPVPVHSKKRSYSQQLLIILKKQNALVLFPEKSILNFLSSTQINEMFFVFFSSHWRAFSTSKRKLLRFVVFEQTFDQSQQQWMNCSW